jgi:hypothetical protein
MFTIEELDELVTRSSENENDPEDEMLDIVRPECNKKFLNQIFVLSRLLSHKCSSWIQIWRGATSLKENFFLM